MEIRGLDLGGIDAPVCARHFSHRGRKEDLGQFVREDNIAGLMLMTLALFHPNFVVGPDRRCWDQPGHLPY